MEIYSDNMDYLKSWLRSTEDVVSHLLGVQRPLRTTLLTVSNDRPGSIVFQDQYLSREATALQTEFGKKFASTYL
jgi:hypothetical protein